MGQLADTLTTRDAVRKAVVDDIIGRAQVASQAIDSTEGLEGVEFLSMGTLRELCADSLRVVLPPPSDTIAEVTTPATVTVHVICPDCKLPAVITGTLTPTLTVTLDGSTVAATWKAKSKAHLCGQLPLAEADGQTTLEDAAQAIDARLVILAAVAAAGDAYLAVGGPEPAPAPTLGVVFDHLYREVGPDDDEIAGLQADLREALDNLAYREDPALVAIGDHGPDDPLTYTLTEEGAAYLDAHAEAAAPTGDGDWVEEVETTVTTETIVEVEDVPAPKAKRGRKPAFTPEQAEAARRELGLDGTD
jgi:hypothetical protein